MVLSVIRQAELYDLINDVEVVISDNASTDDTQSMITGLQRQTRVRIRFHRNDMNLGAIKNILINLSLACGQYWMFYGDDDLMVDGALPLILRTFREYPEVPVFMFKQEPVLNKAFNISIETMLSSEEVARRFFYYIGNAGVFALKTQDAQAQLNRWGIDRFQTCWPTTQLAFMTMAASSLTKPLLAVPIASCCSLNHGQNTVYTSWYIWETMFFALYRTALQLRPILGQPFFEAACAHIFAWKRTLGIAKSLLVYTTLFDFPEQIKRTRQATWHSLYYATLNTLPALLLMWLISVAPRPLKLLGLLGAILLRWPSQAKSRLHQMREKVRAHQERYIQANERRVMKARIYNPSDL
jgi:glycosyltransferase involved in cell wall biosynthesis